jgi:hypothetical protein
MKIFQIIRDTVLCSLLLLVLLLDELMEKLRGGDK